MKQTVTLIFVLCFTLAVHAYLWGKAAGIIEEAKSCAVRNK